MLNRYTAGLIRKNNKTDILCIGTNLQLFFYYYCCYRYYIVRRSHTTVYRTKAARIIY